MKTRIVIFFLAAVIISLISFADNVFADASGSFGIMVSPEAGKSGDSFTVTVIGKDIKNLSAYEVLLTFENKLLEFETAVSAIEGYSVLQDSVNENEVKFATAKYKEKPQENGNITLCTLTFKGKAAGTAKVTLKSVKLMDKVLASTDYLVENTVSVSITTRSTTQSTTNPNVTIFDPLIPGYPAITFKDVTASAWYYKVVGFMAARGIIQGVGDGRFAPERYVTRADFLIMVMRAYGISPDTSKGDNFADAGNKYYTPYLAAAKRLGLVIGVGNNRYTPEKYISRQDMFVLLYQTLEKLDKLPQGTSGRILASFKDAGRIAGYAKKAMKLFVETGIVQGDGVKIAPTETSTRVQAAQVLYNLLSKQN